jgi:hypothetical protein
MSNEVADRQQQEMRNFMSLLPLTIAIAGLPEIEAGRHLNEGQMDVRATQLRMAYKLAKRVVRDVAKEATHPQPAAQ